MVTDFNFDDGGRRIGSGIHGVEIITVLSVYRIGKSAISALMPAAGFLVKHSNSNAVPIKHGGQATTGFF